MRKLTAKQKKLLIGWYKAKEPTREEKLLFGKINPLFKVEDLTDREWETLQEINDTEVLYQNVNGFLSDVRDTLN